ncbi:hypothetical protein ACFZC3_13280 [Streptomyces sp. NPDC007903]|uniref:hypothetical protein n=1 Tax=Streptomyces sp. NPDC007903 TaxID=3364786 RepID=UPI0036EB7BD4
MSERPFPPRLSGDKAAIMEWLRREAEPSIGGVPRDSLDLAMSQHARLARKLGAESPVARRRATLRFHSSDSSPSEMPVPLAVALIGDFQGMITAAAESLRAKSIDQDRTRKAARKKALRSSVELMFSPQPTPGSTIFHLWQKPPAPDEGASVKQGTLDIESGPPLVDVAISKVMDVLDAARAANPSATELRDTLGPLGITHAGRLQSLVKNLLNKDMDLDLTWGDMENGIRSTSLHRREAAFLKSIVSKVSEQNERVDLSGVLRTVSNLRKVDLQLEDGRIITADLDPSLTDENLGQFYMKPVSVVADAETVWQNALGRARRTYTFLSITAREH